MSGPKCSELSPNEVEALRLRNAQRARSSLAGFVTCELEFRALVERLFELGESPPELIQGSQLRATIVDLVNRGLESEAANLADRELATANATLAQARTQLERCVAAVQRRHRQAGAEAEALAREIAALSRFRASSELPAEDRAKIATLLKDLQNSGVPEIPLPELNSAGLCRLDAAEASLKETRQRVALARREMESLLNEFHSAQFLQKSQASVAAIQKLEEFLAAQPREMLVVNDPTLAKLDKLLVGMVTLESSANWADLMRQVESIRREVDLEHRRTLYEALAISFNAQLRHLREVDAWRKDLRNLLGQAIASSSAAALVIGEEIRTLDRAGRVADLSELRVRLARALAEEEMEQQSQRRRRAVLDSLAKLGYEVEEGLETAMVQGGKLVMRKADEDEYAVELIVNSECSLVQTAVIRYAANLEHSPYQHLRDREREDTWCRDYARWQQELKDEGWNTTFKLRVPAGQMPVRTIVDQSKIKASRTAARKGAARQRVANP